LPLVVARTIAHPPSEAPSAAALASGETLRIFNGSTLLGSASVNNTAKTWSYTPTLPATAGTTYRITARVADAAGNLGTASTARSFVLDTVAPSLRFTAAGSNNRINGTTTGLRITAAGADPNRRVDLVVNGRQIAQANAANNGSVSFALTPANIQLIGQGSRNFLLRQTDLAGNTGSTTRRVTVNTRSATSQRDRLTGINQTRDTFSFARRQDSLLGAYDTITNFERLDRISIGGARYAASLRATSGSPISRLTATEINRALGGRQFGSNKAAAFQARGFNGTFIALNDNRPGFQANSDAVIFLAGFRISGANPITVV
jgi:hypothetical protein